MLESMIESYLKAVRRTDPVDIEDMKDAVKRCYWEQGWMCPDYFLFFDDIISASAAVNILNNPDDTFEHYGQLINSGRPIKPSLLIERMEKLIDTLMPDDLAGALIIHGRHMVKEGLLGLQPRIMDVITRNLNGFIETMETNHQFSSFRGRVMEEVRSQLQAQNYVAKDVEGKKIDRNYLLPHNATDYLVPTASLIPSLCVLDFSSSLKYNRVDSRADGIRGLVNSCFMFAPFEHICVLINRPLAYHFNERGLHCDGGPAFNYGYGFNIWALNGIIVPRVVAEEKADKIPAKMVLDERNVDVRREIVRKIGIERTLVDLRARVVDRKGNYELVVLRLREGPRPFLKMLNPSIGVWHVEGVDIRCQTVDEALTWRNGTPERPRVLT